jgi:hypothetical protein
MPDRNTPDTIVVFTARSPERIVRECGSQAWVLNPARAKSCTYLVCTQNRHNPDVDFSDATEPHGTAFLLGKISALRRSAEDPMGYRWLIEINEFARINYPDLWDHGRNPVRYTSLEELGISLEGVEFQPVPSNVETTTTRSNTAPTNSQPATLTISEAKKALAATFGVKPEAVEITIRG